MSTLDEETHTRPSESLTMQKLDFIALVQRVTENVPRQVVSDRAAKTAQDVRGRRQCRHLCARRWQQANRQLPCSLGAITTSWQNSIGR